MSVIVVQSDSGDQFEIEHDELISLIELLRDDLELGLYGASMRDYKDHRLIPSQLLL